MPEQSGLNLFRFEWLSQKRIFKEIDLADAQIFSGVPIAVHLVEHVRRERTLGLRHFGWSLAVGGDGVDKASSKRDLTGLTV